MQTLQSGDLRKFHVIKGPHARSRSRVKGGLNACVQIPFILSENQTNAGNIRAAHDRVLAWDQGCSQIAGWPRMCNGNQEIRIAGSSGRPQLIFPLNQSILLQKWNLYQ